MRLIFILLVLGCLLCPCLAWNPFDFFLGKNGVITNFVQVLPGGGLLTAAFHAAAGNTKHAVQAAVAGYGTLAGLVIGGPPAVAAVGLAGVLSNLNGIVENFVNDAKPASASTTQAASVQMKPEQVAGLIIAKAADNKVSQLFDDMDLSSANRDDAVRSLRSGDSERAGKSLLDAFEQKVAQSTRKLSAEAGGRRKIKSAHGTYLRALERDWKVDVASGPAHTVQQWYIEDWKGKVVLKARGGPHKPGQFLRALKDGSLNLTGKHPKDEPLAIWKPFKNDDGTWSFLSVHGTWLGADSNGAVYTTVDCKGWERFTLETW